jgi:hypothetical protein
MGKTYMVERVLSIEYDVFSERADGICNQAARQVGLDEVGVPATLKALRDGSLPNVAVDAYYQAHDGVVEEIFQEAKKYGVTPVLEGYSLMYAEESESVIRAAKATYGEDAKVIRAFVRADYSDWLAHLVSRATERRRDAIKVAAMSVAQWERRVVPPEQIDGLDERIITSVDELRDLVTDLEIPRHLWYQGFQIGPIEVRAMTNAHEKVATIDSVDIENKSMIDLCCATAVTSFLFKDLGATSVVGIESNPSRVGKAQELAKTLRRQAGFPRQGVKVLLGDAFSLIGSMEADTVVMLGALHYFEDYHQVLSSIEPASRAAIYIEVLLTDRGKGSSEPAGDDAISMTSFDRANGSTIYAPDTPTFTRITNEALSDFELVSRVPSQGLGDKGPDTYREVWGFRRTQPAATTPSG